MRRRHIHIRLLYEGCLRQTYRVSDFKDSIIVYELSSEKIARLHRSEENDRTTRPLDQRHQESSVAWDSSREPRRGGEHLNLWVMALPEDNILGSLAVDG